MSFEEFAAARSASLLRYAVLLSGDREEARDIVQEVLARALVKWGRIGSVHDPYGYVRRMVTNEFLSLRRRRRVWTVPLGPDAVDGASAPRVPEPDDDLWHLLMRLPRQQRAVIVLRYYESLSDLEIAEVLGCRTGGTIAAHDPGTFDPTRLRRGEQITVHGHPAFYVQNLDPPAPSAPAGTNASGPDSSYRIGAAVGWQDSSGAWVTVSDGASRAAMLRLAESVRLTPPRTARAPVRFGWVPLDLPVTYIESRDVAAHGVSANIGFGGPAEPSGQPSSPFFTMPYDTPLSVSVLPMEGIMTAWGEDYADRPMRTIAGHRTWYIEGDAGPFGNRDGSHMLIQAGSCGITIAVRDRVSIPSAALERMVENMTFGGCDDTSDWLPIVGS
ncbi:SigE family RNA polymerase sigma factor [Paractinoplanes hotanensis]|uniref:SigE family RNA polymerase sigma factor n=1 Tax=Paractinoplanes hotanensis TaxID=2906497 RepID=A0ABT0XVZ1_9ACTN|nr:SigE family RNA polymerase sigma factor [Actinoplanes hotanensis]MCM4077962.1 SigE family RNA polymerase sigma factor [Actinoplanes hotanensis]